MTRGREHALVPIAITPAEGHALRSWTQRERATNTVEIGLAYAFAALAIVGGLLASLPETPRIR